MNWIVICADALGVTVEATDDDPESLINRIASWAQQEEDRWPEHGLIYMLIAPEDVHLIEEVTT